MFEDQKGGQSGGAEPKPNSITGKSGHKDGNKSDQNIKALQVMVRTCTFALSGTENHCRILGRS